MSDVWNTSPAFGYPYVAPNIDMPPAASTLIDGRLAQQVVGASAYAFWQRHA